MTKFVKSMVAGAAAMLIPLSSVAAADWRPVTPEELALKAPRVEHDADAEILSWDVHVGDEIDSQGEVQNIQVHSIRIKIFTDTGKEKLGTVDIPYGKKTSPSDVAGRTIKPDGSIIPLTKDAVFDRVVAKGGGLKVKQRSFAMPGVEPGAIIEYTWKEVHADEVAEYLPLSLQREYPVERLTYHIKPLALPGLRMRSLALNATQAQFSQEGKGLYSATWNDIPAYHDEPLMPPEDEVRRWMLVYYEPDNISQPDKFWKDIGKETYKSWEAEIKVNGDVKQIAAQAVNGAATDEEKLKRLLHYCQTNIKNIYSDQVTAEERQSVKLNHNSVDTLHRGLGTTNDVQVAFVALARAAGYDARIARLSDRGEYFFRRNQLTGYFLQIIDVAVQLNGAWRFYDPSSPNVPAGMLRWQEEGLDALITDPKEPVFVKTPVTTPEKSSLHRMVTGTLDEQGTLEATVRETLGGQIGLRWRFNHAAASKEEQEQFVKDRVAAHFSGAEVSKIIVFVPPDLDKQVVLNYEVKVPVYAQRTGKRLFVAPSFFEASKQARFTAGTRRYPIYFDFPWSEVDHVDIAIPAGYVMDHPDAPLPVRFEPVGICSVKIGLSKENHLIFDRNFVFGATNDVLLFPAESYPVMKKVFDQIHDVDEHLITFKVADASGTAPKGGSR
jgi:Domain of Unknown Function with PDB structure (DUF3857)/Transglutaminase-like superfamily